MVTAASGTGVQVLGSRPRLVLAIEHHVLFTEGLRHLLPALGPRVRLSVATSRDSAVAALERSGHRLDLVVLDLGLPGARPFELLAESRRAAPQAPVALLAATEDSFEMRRAFELGAQAYLSKSAPSAEIAAALRHLMHGEIVAPDLRELRADPNNEPTPRQLAVLRLLAQGISNKEIANELGVTENTVKVHLAHCYRLLGVTTRTAAVRRAVHAGLIADE